MRQRWPTFHFTAMPPEAVTQRSFRGLLWVRDQARAAFDGLGKETKGCFVNPGQRSVKWLKVTLVSLWESANTLVTSDSTSTQYVAAQCGSPKPCCALTSVLWVYVDISKKQISMRTSRRLIHTYIHTDGNTQIHIKVHMYMYMYRCTCNMYMYMYTHHKIRSGRFDV